MVTQKHQGMPTALSDVKLQATSQEREQRVTDVTMDSSVFWDVIPQHLFGICRRFGESCCIHQQARLSTDVSAHTTVTTCVCMGVCVVL